MHSKVDHNTQWLLAIAGGLFLVMCVFAMPVFVSAAGVDLGLTPEVGEAIGLGTTDIRITVARIIRTFIGLLGIVAVVIILYGGFVWMTSGGDATKVDKARKIITNGVIGLAIILASFAIAQFVLNSLLGIRTGGGPGGGRGDGSGGITIPLSGSLGNGIIESHYPERGQTDVPRNSRIIVTFKQPIELASIIRGYDNQGTPDDLLDDYPAGGPEAPTALESDNVKIYIERDGAEAALASDEVRVGFTPDRETFVFMPPLLGSPAEDTVYNVKLEPGIRKADGDAAFAGAFSGGYLWDFVVGTFIDLTPPHVVNVIPFADSTNPRNMIVQVNFNEAMDPTSVSGVLPGFSNVPVESGDPSALVPGTWSAGNRYRTIEFITNDLCGTNSCGGDVYCLPADSFIQATVKAATLSETPPAADPTRFPADGATDITGNSLDGDRDGTATGPDSDNYVWSFSTNDTIDLTPPTIQSVDPRIEQGGVPFEKPITVVFDKLMSTLSFKSAAMPLVAVPPPVEPTCFNWYGTHIDTDGSSDVERPVKTKAVMRHCLFQPDTSYIPEIKSEVKDLLQNCYYPGASSVACSPTEMEATGSTYCCSGDPCTSACVIVGSSPRCP